MVCAKCGHESPDGALFCSVCGNSLDQRKRCPSCNAIIADEESVYCANCGARIDGKIVCECGNVFEGNFCPKCGRRSVRIVKAHGEETVKKAGWQKVLSIASYFTLLFGAVMAFIFTFFIGVEADGVIDVATGGKVENDLFYYFGDAHKEIEKLFDSLVGFTPEYEIAMRFNAILNTVIAALILGAMGVFFIITLCKMTTSLIRKKELSIKLPLLTTLLYICGAVLFLSLNLAEVSVLFNEYETIVNYIANGATKSGLIISIITICIALALKIASKYQIFLDKTKAVNVVIGLVKAVLVSVVISLAIMPVLLEMKEGLDFAVTAKSSSLFYLEDVAPFVQTEATLILNEKIAMPIITNGIVAGILNLVVTVLGTIIVWKNLAGLEEEKAFSISSLVLESIATAVAIAYLIFAIKFTDALPTFVYELDDLTDTKIDATIGKTIASLVMIVFTLASGIAQTALGVFFKKNERESLMQY